jgi:hypothetical protein
VSLRNFALRAVSLYDLRSTELTMFGAAPLAPAGSKIYVLYVMMYIVAH